MTDDIKVTLCVLLNDGRTNLSEDIESLRGVYETFQANLTSVKHERYVSL